MESRFGIVPMILCMLSGVAVYVLVQQMGVISPLQMSSPQSVYFDLEPAKPSRK